MILVVQAWLPHFRRELFNSLCKLGPVTVAHAGASVRQPSDRFEEVLLPATKRGPFRLQPGLFDLIKARRPEAIIAMFDIRWLDTIRAMYRFDREIAWIWWGLAPGNHAIALPPKLAVARRPNPIVFYDAATYDALKNRIPNAERLFVANNTFHVPDRAEAYLHPVKSRFLNVGSLNARKQNDVTIRAFANIIRDRDDNLRLTLIGEGEQRETLTKLVQSLGMEDRVDLLGPINDPAALNRYYCEAIASVSFGQAGLAVLQSMAFGVPFVTKKNAVSGGEISNITSGENGILCEDDPDSLEKAMRQLIDDPQAARQMGQAAFEHYSTNATLENMVASFVKAIHCARDKRASRLH